MFKTNHYGPRLVSHLHLASTRLQCCSVWSQAGLNIIPSRRQRLSHRPGIKLVRMKAINKFKTRRVREPIMPDVVTYDRQKKQSEKKDRRLRKSNEEEEGWMLVNS